MADGQWMDEWCVTCGAARRAPGRDVATGDDGVRLCRELGAASGAMARGTRACRSWYAGPEAYRREAEALGLQLICDELKQGLGSGV